MTSLDVSSLDLSPFWVFNRETHFIINLVCLVVRLDDYKEFFSSFKVVQNKYEYYLES